MIALEQTAVVRKAMAAASVEAGSRCHGSALPVRCLPELLSYVMAIRKCRLVQPGMELDRTLRVHPATLRKKTGVAAWTADGRDIRDD